MDLASILILTQFLISADFI